MKNIFSLEPKHRGSVIIIVVCLILLLLSVGAIAGGAGVIGDRTGVGGTLTSGDGSGGCTSGEMDQNNLDAANANKSVYQDAAAKTGVPWEFLAGLHYRETNFGNTAANGDGPFQVQGATYQTFGVDSAVEAANKAKSLVKGSYGKTLTSSSGDETIKLAYLAYNRGVMYKRAGCTWDDSPYVMNNFDADHKDMSWPDSACEVVPPATIVKGKVEYGRLGAFTVYSILKGQIEGSADCDNPQDTNGNGVIYGGGWCGVVAVDLTNIDFVSSHSSAVLMEPAANSLKVIAAEYKRQTGKKLPIASMFRTYAQQTYMYAHPESYDNPARPGTSPHEAGLAFDASLSVIGQTNYGVLKKIAADNGWRPISSVYGASEDHHFNFIQGYNHFGGYPQGNQAAIKAAKKINCN